MGVFSCASVLGVVIVAYLALGVFQIYQLMNPLNGVEIVGPTLDPLWEEHQSFDFFAFLATNNRLTAL